jgi:hypothetical protein
MLHAGDGTDSWHARADLIAPDNDEVRIGLAAEVSGGSCAAFTPELAGARAWTKALVKTALAAALGFVLLLAGCGMGAPDTPENVFIEAMVAAQTNREAEFRGRLCESTLSNEADQLRIRSLASQRTVYLVGGTTTSGPSAVVPLEVQARDFSSKSPEYDQMSATMQLEAGGWRLCRIDE